MLEIAFSDADLFPIGYATFCPMPSRVQHFTYQTFKIEEFCGMLY